jgi:hypothetical protein
VVAVVVLATGVITSDRDHNRAPSSTPTPLHRQIKVLHEALARIFFHAFKHKRD